MQSTDIRPIEVEGRVVGFGIFHPRADDPSRQCGVSVGIAPWGRDWPQWSEGQPAGQPLTLAPSVVCRNCPAHGFVRGGVFTY